MLSHKLSWSLPAVALTAALAIPGTAKACVECCDMGTTTGITGLSSLFSVSKNPDLSVLRGGPGLLGGPEATNFTANITHGQEVPPTPDRGMNGSATLLLNDTQTALTFTITINNVDFTGAQTPGDASDNMTAAHIHAAPFGTNGSVVFGFVSPNSDTNPPDLVITPFAVGVGGTITGKWDTPEGNGTTLTAQLPNLLAGNTYINVHTQRFGGGEIRGQILVVPEPASIGLLTVGAAFALRRRSR